MLRSMLNPMVGVGVLTVALIASGFAEDSQEGRSAHKTQNLVINGSFEEGPEPGGFITLSPSSNSLPGWTITRDTIDYIGSYFPSAHGGRHLDMDGTPGFGAIRQILKTEAGQEYTLKFKMAGNPQGTPQIKVLRVSAGDQSKTYTHGSDTQWQEESLRFKATGGQTPLVFESGNNDGQYCGALLDAVCVLPGASSGFAGTWNTNWGTMVLKVQGNKVTGHYTHDQGKISGTLLPDGSMKVWWSESPSYKAPKDAGSAVIRLDATGQKFTGPWGYGQKLDQGDWTASKVDSSGICFSDGKPAPAPQKETNPISAP